MSAAVAVAPEYGATSSELHDMMGDVPTRSVDLVGRDAELEELCSRLGIVASPDADGPPDVVSRALVLGGDAGVGKTRLLMELRDHAVTAGWRVLAGHCLDLSDSAPPYLPFTEILGRLTTELPEVTEETLVDQPSLRRLQPGRRVQGAGDSGDESSLERADLYEAIHVLLERAGEQGPLLVVVEDVHWADRSTRDLLSFLFARRFSGPVVLVVSYRADDLHRRHPLRRQVAEWSRLRVDRMLLEPLPPEAVRRLVRVLHPDPLDERAVDDIVARAEGNAFFVEELVGAAWATGGVPADLADLLLVRLDRLDDDTQEVIRTAAVAGRKVGHDLLAAVSGLEARALEDALRVAVERHLLVAGHDDTYSFRHALLAEAVYDDLLPGERVRRHAAYARVLGAGSVPGTSAELARHARLGQDLHTALLASVDAGAEAMRVGGPDEAAHHYEQALELAADRTLLAATGVDLVDLVLRAADALTAAGHAHRAHALLRAGLAQLSESGGVDGREGNDVARGLLLSQLALGLYVIDNEGEDELAMAEESVRLLESGSELQQARALASYARILAGHRREQEARKAGTTALAISKRLDMPRLTADILTTLAALQREHLGDDVRDALAEVIGEARATGAVHAEMRGLYTLGRLLQDRGELEEAIAVFETGLARGVQIGLRWAPYCLDAVLMAASARHVLGRWDEVSASVAHAHEAPSELVGATLTVFEALVAAGRGRADAASLLAGLRKHWGVEGFLAVHAAGAEMELAEQAADADAALEVYRHVVDVVGTLWRPHFQARLRLAAQALGVLGTAAVRLTAAEREALRPEADRLLAEGRQVVAHHREQDLVFGPETRGWIERLEAEHLRWRWLAQVDPPEPARLLSAWQHAEERFTEFGHVHELARIRIRLAEVHRGQGDLDRARVVADEAREAAVALGAQPLLTALAALGQTPRGAARRAGSPADGTLTPREQEILALVAEGRTNGEIGKQLFIATKTVSVHVSNILAKLGAASRTEAAAVARRRGLLG